MMPMMPTRLSGPVAVLQRRLEVGPCGSLTWLIHLVGLAHGCNRTAPKILASFRDRTIHHQEDPPFVLTLQQAGDRYPYLLDQVEQARRLLVEEVAA